jgi:putative ABC transport system permease protein
MLRNYLKMALKVLQRRKFYTFISMFGICITLTILLVSFAFWEHATGAQIPEVNLDRSLYISQIEMRRKNDERSMGPLTPYFLETYVKNLKTPSQMSFFSIYQSANTYVNRKKIDLDLKYTDAAFWEVMQFTFVEGRPYTEEEFTNRAPVAVISKVEKEKIFGKSSALGKEVKINQERYQVIGVVENVPVTRIYAYGSFFLPYTLNKIKINKADLVGQYVAVLVAGKKQDIGLMQDEFAAIAKQIENPDPESIASIHVHADPYLDSFSRVVLGSENSTGVEVLYIILWILIFMFLLLPTINLININVSRIQERASEIGVRKAFGASSAMLVVQFVIENLLLTLLCGALSVVLAYGILYIINASHFIPYAHLTINGPVLFSGFMATVFFGLLSGVYPAWRMAALQPAEALKSNT